MVTDLCRVSAKIDTSRLYSVRWRFTTDEWIATWTGTPLLTPLRLIKNFVKFGSATPVAFEHRPRVLQYT